MKDQLGKVSILKDLEDSIVHDISSLTSIKSYPAKTVIFDEGCPSDCIFFILKGYVELQMKNYDNDKYLTFCTLPENEVLGEMAFIDSRERSSRAITKTDTTLAFIEKNSLNLYFEEHPRSGYHFMKSLAALISKRLRLANNLLRNSL